MNLAWVAAVLRPHAIAPHPNLRDDDYDSRPIPLLAAVVTGRLWQLIRGNEVIAGSTRLDTDLGVRNAELSLHSETSKEALTLLVRDILTDPPADLARSCALALVACSVAAESDDYDLCDRILGRLLESTPGASVDEVFLRVVLLQQKCLRLRDSGRDFVPTALEVFQMLNELDVRRCSVFELAPRVAEESVTTLENIVVALRYAVLSLIPFGPFAAEFSPAVADAGVPSLRDQIREPESEQVLMIERAQADAYGDFLGAIFDAEYRNASVITMGRVEPDLFATTLSLEMLGHGRVYYARKELALMRLVHPKSSVDRVDYADSLRLLRQANADKELELVVERFRAAGPLSALSQDARQVLLRRNSPRLLRAPELRVLGAAAELMTPPEASSALDSVTGVISAGGPRVSPGAWQLSVVGMELAWTTAAVLANAAGRQSELAGLLLTFIGDLEIDELWDRAIGRTLRSLEWKEIEPGVKARWVERLVGSSETMTATAKVVEDVADVTITRLPVDVQSLGDAADHLNALLRGSSLSDAQVTDATTQVRQAMRQIRDSADRGSYSYGGVRAADVAAVLISRAGVTDLWLDLASFLLDPAVQQSDRSGGFDRLAWDLPEMPIETAALFRRASKDLLAASKVGVFMEGHLTPFPAALRFLASYALIDEGDLFGFVAQLAGGSSSIARMEAARTVSTIARRSADSWLLAVAMQLSHDSNVTVKAHAGGALALLAVSLPELEHVASQRLIGLLREDGLLVPLLVLRELRQHERFPDVVDEEIARLAVAHPSRLIRRTAGSFAGQPARGEPTREDT